MKKYLVLLIVLCAAGVIINSLLFSNSIFQVYENIEYIPDFAVKTNLSYLKGMSISDIADILGQTPQRAGFGLDRYLLHYTNDKDTGIVLDFLIDNQSNAMNAGLTIFEGRKQKYRTIDLF